MAGIAIILDLLRKNPSFYTTQTQNCVHSLGAFSAAASLAAGTPFAYKALFGNFRTPVARCDAAGVAAWSDDYVASLRSASEKIFQSSEAAIGYSKEYNVELKPLFSAFEPRAFGLMTLRALLTFYLPLVEPRSISEEDDDFLQDAPEESSVDYIAPLKKSAKQIGRETTVVTTRRVLERMTVHYVSQRMAWKLLKDVPKSAVRKAGRRLPSRVFFFRVSRTTFRGHFLAVAASWIVQVAIETYRFFRNTLILKEEVDQVEPSEQFKLLGKKVSSTTVKCGASLVFASIGAGIGAVLIRPSIGQWIGCAVGDLSGPILVSYCVEKFTHIDI